MTEEINTIKEFIQGKRVGWYVSEEYITPFDVKFAFSPVIFEDLFSIQTKETEDLYTYPVVKYKQPKTISFYNTDKPFARRYTPSPSHGENYITTISLTDLLKGVVTLM